MCPRDLAPAVSITPRLVPANALDLIEAASHKTKAAMARLVAVRTPQPDVPTSRGPVASVESTASLPAAAGVQSHYPKLAPGPVVPTKCDEANNSPTRIDEPAPQVSVRSSPCAPSPPRVEPRSADRFALQLTIAASTHDKLRHAQELLGHAIAPGELAEVLDRVLTSLVEKLQKARGIATSRRPARRESHPGRSATPRLVPASVGQAVWRRDEGRCTFRESDGCRCEARGALELDHIVPVARGGPSTVANRG